jgi:hypothetical protein
VASVNEAVAAAMGMAPDGSSVQVFSGSDSDWEGEQVGAEEKERGPKKAAPKKPAKKGAPKKPAKKGGGAKGKRAGGGKKAAK